MNVGKLRVKDTICRLKDIQSKKQTLGAVDNTYTTKIPWNVTASCIWRVGDVLFCWAFRSWQIRWPAQPLGRLDHHGQGLVCPKAWGQSHSWRTYSQRHLVLQHSQVLRSGDVPAPLCQLWANSLRCRRLEHFEQRCWLLQLWLSTHPCDREASAMTMML